MSQMICVDMRRNMEAPDDSGFCQEVGEPNPEVIHDVRGRVATPKPEESEFDRVLADCGGDVREALWRMAGDHEPDEREARTFVRRCEHVLKRQDPMWKTRLMKGTAIPEASFHIGASLRRSNGWQMELWIRKDQSDAYPDAHTLMLVKGGLVKRTWYARGWYGSAENIGLRWRHHSLLAEHPLLYGRWTLLHHTASDAESQSSMQRQL